MDGIININKPSGITSFDVIRKLRKIIRMKKIGHTGTLDPLATGVLVICTGRGTKLVQDIEKMEKEYIAEFDLGYMTDTYDTEGKVLAEVENFSVSKEDIEKVLEKFRGDILQVPPMYSALKVNGEKLYDLARRGEVIEREARPVTIKSLELLEFDGKKAKIVCMVSKGTYIRSLIFDIGNELKTYATMTSLVRTSVGSETLNKSFTLEEVEELHNKEEFSYIRSVEEYFDYPEFRLEGDKNITLFLNGQTVVTENETDGMRRVYIKNEDGEFKFQGLGNVVSNRLKGYKYY